MKTHPVEQRLPLSTAILSNIALALLMWSLVPRLVWRSAGAPLLPDREAASG